MQRLHHKEEEESRAKSAAPARGPEAAGPTVRQTGLGCQGCHLLLPSSPIPRLHQQGGREHSEHSGEVGWDRSKYGVNLAET